MIVSRIALVVGGIGGLVAAFAIFSLINIMFILPAAREEGKQRVIAEQAVQAQKEELERKGDDAKLQRMSDFDLCVAYLGGVPECESLKLQPVPEK